MKKCASLHGRVAAATELFRRGEKDAVPAMIDEWRRWKPSTRTEFDDDKEEPDPLVVFLGTCGDVPAMKALTGRFASLPPGVKFKVIEVATDTGVLHESARDEKTPLPAEVEALGEDLAVAALNDRSARYGMSISRDDVTFRDPRVCDIALDALARRWPQRYAFKWSPTRIGRDTQTVAAANVWRTAHGLAALPLPGHPAHESAGREPNVVSSLKWIGGPPPAGVSMAEGKPLTADALVETLILLHRKLPKGFAGFDFTAERAGDRRGFFVEIKWAAHHDINPGGSSGGDGWSYHIDISLGDESLYEASGGASSDRRAAVAGYEDEKRALVKAFAADAGQPIVISFSTRLSRD